MLAASGESLGHTKHHRVFGACGGSLGHNRLHRVLELVENPWPILSTMGCLVLLEDLKAKISTKRVLGSSGESLGHN